MSQSIFISKFSRLALLSVFCTGLFLMSGEINIDNSGTIQIGNGGVHSVMAADETKPVVDETINSIISVLNLGIGVLTFLITPLIMLAGWLLSPDWTFGEIFGLRPILHQLWILISNVVYVIFGFMLVFVAFANIFGGEHSKAYEMKTMLPKLVTGMLMVPFTWFIVSAVLSVSNVLTASVISLPMETILKSDGTNSKLLNDKIIPKTIIFNKDIDFSKEYAQDGDKDGESRSIGSGEGALTANGNFMASDCAKGSSDCLSIKEFLTGGGGGAYNLLSVYAYGIFKIQGYKSITVGQKINKVIDIASKLGFGIIFFVIFGILVIAIVYALFSRALMLWLFAIFSPLFALMYVMGKSEKFKALEHFSVGKFISLAMVPVYVSAALAFGLMFLGLVMGASGGKADGTLKSNVIDIKNEPGSSTTAFKFGEVTLTTIGLLDPEAKNGVSGALDIGKGIIGTIIMNVLALVILWMAVMAALGSSKITEAAVAPIKGFGDEIGKLAMKAPQYIPIPLGKNKDGSDRSISMAGMGGISSTIKQALDTGASNQGAALGKTFAEGLGLKMSDLGESLRQTTLSMQGKRDLQSQVPDWQKAFSSVGDATNQQNHKDTILPKYKEMLSATKITPEERKPLEELLNAGNLDRFVVDFNTLLTSKGQKIGTGITADAILKSTKSGVTTTSNITINAHPDGTKTDRDLTVEGNSKKFTFDLSLEATKNADSLKDLKGAMKESDLKEALNKCGMEDSEITKLILELKKTANFFKS